MSKNEDTSLKSAIKKAVPGKKNVLAGMNINKLSNMRIIQKHLVYVIGLSSGIANKETLGKFEYFGQYGQILKIVVNKTKAYNPNGPNGPSYSAYISYNTAQEASIAILAIDNVEVDDHILRASYGTTKYCTFFLKNCDCPNKDCLYLHSLADENDIVNRDDMNSHTSIFYDQQLLAIKLADIYNSEIKKKLKTLSKKKTVFPTTESIYSRDIVIELNPIKEERIYKNGSQKSKKKYNDEYYDNYFSNEYDNTNDNTFGGKKAIGSSNKFIVEFDKKENENHSDNNYQLVRENSENLSTLLNKANKKGDLVNKNKSQAFNESSKFISKSKSPITTKKKAMSLIEDKDKKLDGNSNGQSNNYFNSPDSTCKLISFENEATNEKDKEISNQTESNKLVGFEEKYAKIELKDGKSINNSKKEKDKIKEENTLNIPVESKEEEVKIEVKPILKLYRKWERSRFSFANKNANPNNLSFSEDINHTNKTIENNLNNIIMDRDEDTKSNLNNSLTLNSLVNSKNGPKENKGSSLQNESSKKINNKNGFKKNNETFKKIELIDPVKTNNNKKSDAFEDEKINNEDNNRDNPIDIVPDYVYDVIRKKISRHTFFKKLEKEFFNNDQTDFLYFEKDLNHDDSWSQFIINNLEKPKIK